MILSQPAGGRAKNVPARARSLGVALALVSMLANAPATADAPAADAAAAKDTAPNVVVTGHAVPTDGMLTRGEARPLRRTIGHSRVRARADDPWCPVWLLDYMSRLLDREPAIARRHRPGIRTAAAPGSVRMVSASAPVAVAKAPLEPATAHLEAPPVQPSAPASPIVTGAILPARPAAPAAPAAEQRPQMIGPDASQALIVAAERSQLRLDLIKLELAARTYDERKLSGRQVFELRDDWFVLERAVEALSGPELSSAAAAGFEANAYINETTRTIVVAVAGSQDLRRDFLQADVWQALIKSQAPQQFYLAKTYVRSVMQRYQMRGFSTECVGHSLGGGACAYAAAELGIRALVVNPITAGKLPAPARLLVTNYVVDGEIANLVYGARGHEFSGNVQVINDGRDVARQLALEKYGQLAGPILVIRELKESIKSHKVDRALDLIAAQAEVSRPR